MTAGRHRIAVVTSDPVGDRMAGPAIRAWHLAEALAGEHDVRLASTVACERHAAAFATGTLSDAADVGALLSWADVIVVQGGLLHEYPEVVASPAVVVADLYDPFQLENLEQTRGLPAGERRVVLEHLRGVIDEQLRRADLILCASERQRDFWIGALAAAGRVNGPVYDEDPTLRGLAVVVPFGFPPDPPVRRGPGLRGVVPGIGPGDTVLLWAGGVYNWFDPLTLLRAVDRLRRRHPSVRLHFLGLGHPNPHLPAMRVATETRDLSDRLGLTGSCVSFNEGWVEFDRRADYLLDADIGVSTHLDTVETAYSFRTRILDYLWAGLPVVTTDGDAFADLVRAQGIGAVAPAGDVDALEAALAAVLAERPPSERVRAAGAALTWPAVVEPLLRFCRAPRRAPDLVESALAGAPGDGPPAPASRVRTAWRQGGPRLVAARLAASAARRLQPPA